MADENQIMNIDEQVINVPNREINAGSHINIFNYRSSPELQNSTLRIARNVVIKSADSLYSTKTYYRLMILYLVCFICEYLLAFAQVPFEYIKNRPVICIINAIFGIIVFAVSIITFIISATLIPNRTSYMAHFIGVVAQFVSIGLNLPTFALVFLAQTPFITYADDSTAARLFPIDYTLYIKLITSVSLFISSTAFGLALSMLLIYGKGFYRLANRINRLNDIETFGKEQFNGGETILRGDMVKGEISQRIEAHLM